MRTDSDITIFNRRRSDGGNEILQPTFIRRCTWHYAHIVRGSQMMDNADEYSVRIPINADFGGKTYINPHDYSLLNDEDSKLYWTIQKNDLIMRGAYDADVGDQTDITSLTDDVFVVSTLADNTIRGSNRVKHWRAGGS